MGQLMKSTRLKKKKRLLWNYTEKSSVWERRGKEDEKVIKELVSEILPIRS